MAVALLVCAVGAVAVALLICAVGSRGSGCSIVDMLEWDKCMKQYKYLPAQRVVKPGAFTD